jgi:hypothetical protein
MIPPKLTDANMVTNVTLLTRSIREPGAHVARDPTRDVARIVPWFKVHSLLLMRVTLAVGEPFFW